MSKRGAENTVDQNDADLLKHSRAKYMRVEGDGGKSVEKESDSDEDQTKDEQEYKSKHTLDSDEEEDVKYKKLDIEKVDGQEGAEVEFDGNTKITPFNMKEDLEDGHFDTDGNFIFDKKERGINDAWLDNIDWAHVKKAAGDQWQNAEDDEALPSGNTMGDSDLKEAYEKIITHLQPNETIEKAIKRIGKQKLSAGEERKRRWAAKKAGVSCEDETSLTVKQLTGLADSLVSNGDMQAYQITREKLLLLLHHLSNKANDEVDIFSDGPSSSNKESLVPEEKSEEGVLWEYKLSDSADAQVLGPVPSEAMLSLQASGKFDEGAWARKKGTQAYYTVARLDFELYT